MLLKLLLRCLLRVADLRSAHSRATRTLRALLQRRRCHGSAAYPLRDPVNFRSLCSRNPLGSMKEAHRTKSPEQRKYTSPIQRITRNRVQTVVSRRRHAVSSSCEFPDMVKAAATPPKIILLHGHIIYYIHTPGLQFTFEQCYSSATSSSTLRASRPERGRFS